MNQKRRATIIFLVALGAVTLWFCYLIARPFLKPVFFAMVLAIIFHPLHARLHKSIRNANAAALLSTLSASLELLRRQLDDAAVVSQRLLQASRLVGLRRLHQDDTEVVVRLVVALLEAQRLAEEGLAV